MGRECYYCGKTPTTGNQITTRGKAKYLGGVGTKVTGITRRTFKPNLQRLHVTEGKTNKTVLACTHCIRSGVVIKAVKAAPFRLPPSEAAAAAKTGKKPAKSPASAAKK